MIVYMCHIFFTHSSVYRCLDFFHVLAIVDSAPMNIEVHVFFQIMVSSSYIPRSGIDRSRYNSIFSFFKDHFS